MGKRNPGYQLNGLSRECHYWLKVLAAFEGLSTAKMFERLVLEEVKRRKMRKGGQA